MDSAEQAALSHKFEPGLATKYLNSRHLSQEGRADSFRDVHLTPNRHFDHLPVNINFSSVLIPPKVDDQGKFILGLA